VSGLRESPDEIPAVPCARGLCTHVREWVLLCVIVRELVHVCAYILFDCVHGVNVYVRVCMNVECMRERILFCVCFSAVCICSRCMWLCLHVVVWSGCV